MLPTWKELAKKYGVSVPTIGNYRKRGIDIYDEEQVMKVRRGNKSPFESPTNFRETAKQARQDGDTEVPVVEELPIDAPSELREMRRACQDIYVSIAAEPDPIIQNRWRQNYVAALKQYHETLLRYQKSRENERETLAVSDVEGAWGKFLIAINGALENLAASVSMAMDGYEMDTRADVERLVNCEVDVIKKMLSKPVKL